jgi:hypothetical protein
MAESLKIFDNIRELLLKALNTSCCHKGAARRLGVNIRSLPRMKRDYGIIKHGDKWIYEEDKPVKPGHRVVWFNQYGKQINAASPANKSAHH